MSLATERKAGLLDRLFEPVGECLTPEVARRIVQLRADAETQAMLDDFADRNTEGKLSPDEREEYAAYVQALEFMAILQAKARTVLCRAERK